MQFRPTPSQIETIAECETAKMPRALIAERLGIDVATFRAEQLAAAHEVIEVESTEEILRYLGLTRAEPGVSRVIADRIFEGDGGEQIISRRLSSPLRSSPRLS